jgi:hypothetical protein
MIHRLECDVDDARVDTLVMEEIAALDKPAKINRVSREFLYAI